MSGYLMATDIKEVQFWPSAAAFGNITMVEWSFVNWIVSSYAASIHVHGLNLIYGQMLISVSSHKLIVIQPMVRSKTSYLGRGMSCLCLMQWVQFSLEYKSVAASMKDIRGYLTIIHMCISNNRHRVICNQWSNIFGEKHNKIFS